MSRSPTAFEQRVYAALRRIPRGRVVTYKALALYVECGSCRAVGQALHRNPFAPEVPCHRVIASDLTVGGFQGQRSGQALESKLRLLKAEGVRFAGRRLAEPARVWNFHGDLF